MIVKNEEEILEKCLRFVKPIVDEIVIVDTGSTDSTKKIIKKHGRLYEIPFVNYVETKNEALKLVKSDYVLWMDADEILYEGAEALKTYADRGVSAVMSTITEGDAEDYNIVYTQYQRIRLFKNDGTWRFEGPGVHEYLIGEGEVVFDPSILIRHEHLKSDKAETAKQRFER